MADEHQFIENGLQRSQIDEFFQEELGRAGYGGMDVAKTPMGTQIVLKAEKPGMVIGKGGENIRKVTTALEEKFNLEDPQIDVQEVDEPEPQRTNRRGPTAQRARAWLVLPEGRSHDDRPDHGRRRARRGDRPVGEGHRRTIARREVQPRLHQAQRRARRDGRRPRPGRRGHETRHYRR